jgi:hypothetical protein
MSEEHGAATSRITRFFSAAACILMCAVVAGCSFPDFSLLFPQPTGGDVPVSPAPPVDTQAITSSAAQITLQWTASSDAITGYDVYYRAHGTASWILLGQAAVDPTPQYTILHSILGNGSFDFAIDAVNAYEVKSGLHTSLDATAQPSTGWYLEWQVQ